MYAIRSYYALSRLDERLAGYRAGADDYVAKPYNIDELMAKIRIALNNRDDLEMARERSGQMLGNVADSLSTCNELEAVHQGRAAPDRNNFV